MKASTYRPVFYTLLSGERIYQRPFEMPIIWYDSLPYTALGYCWCEALR